MICKARIGQYNGVTNLKVAQNAGNFLTSWTLVASQEGLRSLFHGVSKLAICIRLKHSVVHTQKSMCVSWAMLAIWKWSSLRYSNCPCVQDKLLHKRSCFNIFSINISSFSFAKQINYLKWDKLKIQYLLLNWKAFMHDWRNLVIHLWLKAFLSIPLQARTSS